MAQKELYESVVNRTLRRHLIDKKISSGSALGDEIVVDDEDDVKVVEESSKKRKTRGGNRRDYKIIENDDKYFKQIEEDAFHEAPVETMADTLKAGKDYKEKAAREFATLEQILSRC